MKKIKALICGSFDPVTLGHIDIIRRASLLFDDITVAIFNNSAKKYMFSESERIEMLAEAIKELPNAHAELCSGLVAEYVRKNNINVIVKGVRNQTDCSYEMDMARANKLIFDGCETMLLLSYGSISDISSSLVRAIALNGGDVSEFVPECVAVRLTEKCSK